MTCTITPLDDDVLDAFNAMSPRDRWIHAFAYAHEAWLLWRRLSREPRGVVIGGLTAEDAYSAYEYWTWQQHYASCEIRTGCDTK